MSGAPPLDVLQFSGGQPWMFLRLIDPERPNHALAKPPFNNGGAFAYASPWYFE